MKRTVFAVLILIICAQSVQSFQLCWDHYTDPLGSTIRSYWLQSNQCTNLSLFQPLMEVSVAQDCVPLSGMQEGRTYCFYVTAASAEGKESAASNVAVFQVPKATPSAPTGVGVR